MPVPLPEPLALWGVLMFDTCIRDGSDSGNRFVFGWLFEPPFDVTSDFRKYELTQCINSVGNQFVIARVFYVDTLRLWSRQPIKPWLVHEVQRTTVGKVWMRRVRANGKC